MNIEKFRAIINGDNHLHADFSAPPHGLYLYKIEYPKNSFEKI